MKQRGDVEELRSLIQKEKPDVFAVQEVRQAAAAPRGAKKNDGAPRQRGTLGTPSDKKNLEETQSIERILRTEPLSQYRVLWSLADWKYAGTAMFIKKHIKPIGVKYRLDGKAGHDENGRIILAEFDSMLVLNTYVPNNGWTDEAFAKRRLWDAGVLEFLKGLKKPLVWLGDMNVAHQDADVTHPDFFSGQRNTKLPEPDPENAGQPGFTPAEQKRFQEHLTAGGLVDAFRKMHPSPSKNAEEAHWSWRGSPGNDNPLNGKYYGRGMRIDYALVSTTMATHILRSDILGHGANRTGYMGSDHSPIILQLKAQSKETETKEHQDK